jgi:23S rRNA pseudouridine1911/1915/1917 synthase
MRQSLTEDRILYTDNHLIAVQKRAGEIVQGDKTGDVPLSAIVADYLKVKYNKPGDAFVGVIHRIDRPVSGLVLFARTGKGLSRMNTLFRERKIQKTYRALVEGLMKEDSGVLVHYLSKNETQNRSKAALKPAEGLLRCELEYIVLERTERYTLVEVRPLTGRHHQIRVQLSAIGHPIKGDVKYGSRRGNRDRSICLHAYSLRFEHPVKGEEIEIEASVPKNEAWAPIAEQ